MRQLRPLAVLLAALVLGALNSGALAQGTVMRRSASAAAARPPAWLAEINRYRIAAGLAPVIDEPAWDAGLRAHLRYIARTPTRDETGQYASLHTENPASPFYTRAGALEAGSSDLILGGVATSLQAVDEWLSGPFHAIGMLRPGLRRVALAVGGPRVGGAGLDVIRGLAPITYPTTKPVLFPGNGMTTTLTSTTDGELPDPTQSCRPGTRHDGLPLIVLLPNATPRQVVATLTLPHGATERTVTGSLCLVDQYTFRTTDRVYGPTGRELLQADNAIFLIPHAPLTNGRYSVHVDVAGNRLAWAFRVRAGNVGVG